MSTNTKAVKIGVIGSSLKSAEKRVPIHPGHFALMSEDLRRQLVFEQGYGERFGLSDAKIEEQVGGLASREELLSEMDGVLLLKPQESDLQQMREGSMLWGWPHCVQQRGITQAAIDRRLTLIAFEQMYVWGPQGERGIHTFYKNNELAGYSAVMHAFGLTGIDGNYGRSRRAIIFGFGAVSRGAILALKARGINDITVCLTGPAHLVREAIPGCRYLHLFENEAGDLVCADIDLAETPLLTLLTQMDILINAVLQNPTRPMMFLEEKDLGELKPGCLILDVSCDEGMGFSFARPTSFDEPMLSFGHVRYYAVDHTPSYLWESASWEISAALLPLLPKAVAGPAAWSRNETLRQAIEIEDGVIVNPKILDFQKRQAEYPHASS